jgi:hypothetical protein
MKTETVDKNFSRKNPLTTRCAMAVIHANKDRQRKVQLDESLGLRVRSDRCQAAIDRYSSQAESLSALQDNIWNFITHCRIPIAETTESESREFHKLIDGLMKFAKTVIAAKSHRSLELSWEMIFSSRNQMGIEKISIESRNFRADDAADFLCDTDIESL